MNRLASTALLVAILALALGSAAVPAGAHYRETGRDCGEVPFTPRTDDVAGDIRASHTNCRTARRVVRSWRAGDRTPLGYRCRRRVHDPDSGLAHSDVLCRKGSRRVTWGAF